MSLNMNPCTDDIGLLLSNSPSNPTADIDTANIDFDTMDNGKNKNNNNNNSNNNNTNSKNNSSESSDRDSEANANTSELDEEDIGKKRQNNFHVQQVHIGDD